VSIAGRATGHAMAHALPIAAAVSLARRRPTALHHGMLRLLAAGLVLVLAGGARAEFIAHARDFKCLREGTPVPGKNFVLFHRNPKKLARALRVAESDRPHLKYPVGTIIQVFPFDAMVKRGGSFNPAGGGWEFFNLDVSPDGTRIVGRTQNQGIGLKNVFGSCQSVFCHDAPQARRFDFVCEGHLPPLPVSDQQFAAMRADPRCP
jgi:hypothetical protein